MVNKTDGFYRIDFQQQRELSFISVCEVDHPERILKLQYRQKGEPELDAVDSYRPEDYAERAVFITAVLENTIERNDNCRLSTGDLIIKMLRTLGFYSHRRLAEIYIHGEIAWNREFEGLSKAVMEGTVDAFSALDTKYILKFNNNLWACGWRFDATTACPPAIATHDPEPVDFREEWLDNVGSMANAIPWLRKHWEANVAATGQTFQNNVYWHWHWAPLNEMLTVHTKEQGKYGHIWYEITDNEMKRYDGPSRDWASTYRPFASRSGLGPLTWELTREIKIHTHQHAELVPLSKREAFMRLERRLVQSPMGAFPLAQFNIQLNGRGFNKGLQLTDEEIKVCREVLYMLEVTTQTVPFNDIHMPTYWAFANALRMLCAIRFPDDPNYFKQLVRDETERLVEMGERESAAMMFTFLHENGELQKGRNFIREAYART